jgi:hypothetical protein
VKKCSRQQPSSDRLNYWLISKTTLGRNTPSTKTKANRAIAGQCAKLGIPARFAPEIEMHWYSRGENASKERRAELRKMAMTRIAAIESAAIVEIGKATVEAQMIIAASGLASDAGKPSWTVCRRLKA